MLLNFAPYFMNRNGTSSAKQESPPISKQPGPMPRLVNKGRAAGGSAHASIGHRKVLVTIKHAAYGPCATKG